jgi:hypothetical protein
MTWFRQANSQSKNILIISVSCNFCERGNQSRSSSPDPPYSDPLLFLVEFKPPIKPIYDQRALTDIV